MKHAISDDPWLGYPGGELPLAAKARVGKHIEGSLVHGKDLGSRARELEALLNVVFSWMFLFGVNLRAERGCVLTSGCRPPDN